MTAESEVNIILEGRKQRDQNSLSREGSTLENILHRGEAWEGKKSLKSKPDWTAKSQDRGSGGPQCGGRPAGGENKQLGNHQPFLNTLKLGGMSSGEADLEAQGSGTMRTGDKSAL